jgi:membrane-anchored mycosin MYCP
MRRPRRRASTALRALCLTIAVASVLSLASARPAVAASSTKTCAEPTDKVVTDEPWPQTQLGLRSLQNQYRGWGTTIAVISSGVSASHPQLQGRVLPGFSIGVNGDPHSDCLGFGTATAGAAAAAAVSGTPLVGVAPQATVLPVLLPDWVVNPSSALDDEHQVQAANLLARAITEAMKDGPKVMVLPSVALPNTTNLRNAVGAADEQGCLLVEGATTSSGLDNGRSYPASYPEILVVEGVSPTGELAQTNLGADTVDLAAPGVQVPVLAPRRGHLLVSSNDVAAGYVAGAAALVREATRPKSVAELRNRLLQTSASTVSGGLPALNPSAALTPVGDVPRNQPAGAIGRLLTAKSPPDRAAIAAGVISTTALVSLVLLAFAMAALQRGRRRGWRPAGHPGPAPTDGPPAGPPHHDAPPTDATHQTNPPIGGTS